VAVVPIPEDLWTALMNELIYQFKFFGVTLLEFPFAFRGNLFYNIVDDLLMIIAL